MNYILSIIIPVYNVELYVGKCVESILQQKNLSEKVEILFVIDGSKDNSESIIREKVRCNNLANIKVITKENGGLSSARNLGVELSAGDYIWFVDSDDWIEEDSIEYLLSVIEKNKPEIIAQAQYFQETQLKTHLVKRFQYNGFIDGHIYCGKDHSTAAQFYVVQRKYWMNNSFFFRLGMYHEDGELTPRLLYKSSRIFVITKPLYHILVRDGSITHSVNPKRCYDYMIVLDSLLNFYNDEVSVKNKKAFATLMSDHILGLLNLSLQVDWKTRKDVMSYLKRNHSFVGILTKSTKLKVKTFGYILQLLPVNPIMAYKLIKI